MIAFSGFDDAVLDGRRVFRALLGALAQPGRIQEVEAELDAPPPLFAASASLCLALLDHETPLWLDARADTAVVREYLRFHCGCSFAAAPKEACFALIAEPATMPRLDAFEIGTDEEPERSATLILQVNGFETGREMLLTGPGIESERRLRTDSVSPAFLDELAANHAIFPRGVDTIFAGPRSIAAIPRSTKAQPCT